MIRRYHPLSIDFFPNQDEMPPWRVVLALQIPGTDQENRFFAQFFHAYNAKSELAHGVPVGITALVAIQGLLPAFGDTRGPDELELIRFPVHLHKGWNVALVPVGFLLHEGGTDLGEVGVFLGA